jgi:hypothetical protein
MWVAKGKDMLKYLSGAMTDAAMVTAMTLPARAQTVGTEAVEHPRIAAAIHQMEDAIAYMQAAPHDFGGHKVAAIRATEAAITELRAALAFRARQDRR